MLEYEIWGNTIQKWILSAAIILGTLLLVRLITWLARRWVEPFVRRTNNRMDDLLYDALLAPLRFGVMLLGIWIAIHRLVYPDYMVKYVDYAYRILIVLNITWIFARLTALLLERYWGSHVEGDAQRMMPVVRRMVLTVIWVVGLIMALSNIGIDINALWGTLGIGGIAFALAAQDTVKNLFGAVTIFTDKPFAIGDTINLNGVEGTVIDVGMRSTRILGYDRRVTAYPNYRVAEAAIVNISSEPMRRATVRLELTYDTGAAKMREALAILRDLPRRVKGLSTAPSDLTAYFSEYSESAVVITRYYYILRPNDILKTMSEVNFAILEAFEQAAIHFAFPTRTLQLPAGFLPGSHMQV